jgi:hypothetical protein
VLQGIKGGGVRGPTVVAVTLGLVGQARLAERPERNQRFSADGGVAVTPTIALVAYSESPWAMFVLARVARVCASSTCSDSISREDRRSWHRNASNGGEDGLRRREEPRRAVERDRESPDQFGGRQIDVIAGQQHPSGSAGMNPGALGEIALIPRTVLDRRREPDALVDFLQLLFLGDFLARGNLRVFRLGRARKIVPIDPRRGELSVQ